MALSARGRRVAPAAIAAAAFVFVVALYVAKQHAISASLLTLWGTRPFSFPFVDADTVLSALRCRRMGVDVFASNPCDALGRVYDYSPLWLHASVFPITMDWIVPVGLAVDAAFLASLLLLPAARNSWWTLVIVVAALSTPVAFALERANNDLVIFVLAVLAATLSCMSQAWRWLGYSCAFLAGLLKYYPMLLLAMAVRERPRMFLAVASVSVLLLALFIVAELEPLRRALELIPTGVYFGDMFGARTLPFGVAEVLRLPAWVGRVGELVLDVGSLIAAAWISARARIDEDLRALTERERAFLMAGALLVIGCFISAQNIGYRAIHLLLILPALTALAGGGRHRSAWAASVAVVLLLLWTEGWRHWLDALVEHRVPWADLEQAVVDPPRLFGWAVREACWWWVVTLLWTVTLTLLRESVTGQAFFIALSGRTRAGDAEPLRPSTSGGG